MEEHFSLKHLKSKLDGNRLDLSLCELSVVPTKEIADLKKVTEIDLSSNRIQTLPIEFCNLSNLVELDLSANRLISLPDKFGDLARLQRLDLYKNQLREFPLSFCKLKQLKWLDLKDNPLNDQLRIVAGDCLNDVQCRQAASKVVSHMQKLQSDNERERQKIMAAEREKESAKKLKEEAEHKRMQAEKKKQKENRKKAASNMANGKETPHKQSNGRTSDQEVLKKGAGKTKKEENRASKKSSLSRRICKFLFISFACFVLLSGALAAFLFSQCISSGSSQPIKSDQAKPAHKNEMDFDLRSLCEDLRHLTKTGQLRITWNYQGAWLATKRGVFLLADHLWHKIEKFDFETRRKWLVEKASNLGDHLKPILRYTIENFDQWLRWTWQFLAMWAELTYNFALVLAKIVTQLTVQCFDWTIKNGRDLLENYPTYIDRIKYYWQNMK